MNLNLTDAGLLIFDGIFDGDDLERLFLDLVEGAVKCRRFAGTGWTGDKNDSVRQIDQLLEETVNIGQHADVGKVKDHSALVEQTHHDAFAMDHRDDRNADVDFPALYAHLDAAVLRQPLLGD